MKYLALVTALFLTAACATAPAQAQQTPTCAPAGYTRAQLDALKASEWAVADDAARNTLARAMTSCLGSPDPTLRDGIAFEALQYWMRHRQLSDATMLALGDDLEARLTGPEGQGFERPFSALVLAEIARADRVQPYMTPARRAQLLDHSINYLTNIHDYRGFDAHEGYRHGVAHAADLMLQLTLNPAFGKPELTRIRDAIATQIAPPEHSYIYGESERLATPILYMSQRAEFSEEEWTAWLTSVSGPGPLGATWDNWFLSQAGLARRHDIYMFTSIIYLNADLSASGQFAKLKPGAAAAIAAIP